MDFENLKSDKAKSALNRYRSIGFLVLRVTEISVALLFVLWILTCLPFALRISTEFLRRLACVVSTPLFMFLLSNSIVIALLTTKSSTGAETDIYDAFIRSGENRQLDPTEEIIVYDDKQMITPKTNPNLSMVREIIETVTDSPKKVYRRSKSEQSLEVVRKPTLRRSETEKCRKIVEQVSFEEDSLTNEEFQKTIEAFIAKQLVFRRRESLAVVVHNNNQT